MTRLTIEVDDVTGKCSMQYTGNPAMVAAAFIELCKQEPDLYKCLDIAIQHYNKLVIEKTLTNFNQN